MYLESAMYTGTLSVLIKNIQDWWDVPFESIRDIPASSSFSRWEDINVSSVFTVSSNILLHLGAKSGMLSSLLVFPLEIPEGHPTNYLIKWDIPSGLLNLEKH
jgi:hypothetical protein